MLDLDFGMDGKENIFLLLLLVWIIVFVAIVPNKKDDNYKGSKITRFFCGVSAVLSILAIVFYDLGNNYPSYGNLVIVISLIASIALILCSVLCFRKLLLLKNQGILFKLSTIISAMLIAIGILWVILYWLNIIDFDMYLLMAPSIGSILLSTYEHKNIE